MEYMSREVFHRHRDEITAAVRLLLADPKRRKRFQFATVYEKNRRNELLAEVLSTGLDRSSPIRPMSARAVAGFLYTRFSFAKRPPSPWAAVITGVGEVSGAISARFRRVGGCR
jgi:hypothetical protein